MRRLGALLISPSTTLRGHRDSRFPLGELRLYQPWAPGPARDAAGPHLISVNEYRPHRYLDMVPIAQIAAELKDQVVAMPDAVGVTSAWQPLGGITYSLSLWRSEEALRAFTVSRDHRRVMRDYRGRGYLRHVHWWGEHRSIGSSMAEARRRLDAGEGRRTGEARDRWARRDQRRLEGLA